MPRSHLLLLSLSLAGLAHAGPGALSFDFNNRSYGTEASARAGTAYALSGSLEGIFHNPASLAGLDERVSVSFMYNPIGIQESGGVEAMSAFAVAGAVRIGKAVFAAALHSQSYGVMEGYFDLLSGASIRLSSGSYSASATGSVSVFKALQFGATLHYLCEILDRESISALSFDLGGLVTLNRLIPSSVLNFGISLKNCGSELAEPNGGLIPGDLVFGLSYQLRLAKTTYLQAMSDVHVLFNDQSTMQAGIELGLFDVIFLRGGYDFGDFKYPFGFATGIGFKFHLAKRLGIKVDYSLKQGGELGVQNMFQLNCFLM